MLLFVLLMGSLAFTAGQYAYSGTSTTTSGQPISPQNVATSIHQNTSQPYNSGTSTTTSGQPISPQNVATSIQQTTSQPYNYPVVTGLRLKAKCFRELNATVAEQLLKQYLTGIPPEYFRLTVKNITKL